MALEAVVLLFHWCFVPVHQLAERIFSTEKKKKKKSKGDDDEEDDDAEDADDDDDRASDLAKLRRAVDALCPMRDVVVEVRCGSQGSSSV